MNVKLKVLTVGALFFIGGQAVMAQKKKDSIETKNVESKNGRNKKQQKQHCYT